MRKRIEPHCFLITATGIMVMLGVWVFLVLSGPISSFSAAGREMEDTDPGDCRKCHRDKSLLTADHVPAQGISMDECLDCHEEEGMSLKGKIPGSHLHRLRDIACSDCHGEKKPYSFVGRDACLRCHSSGWNVAELTNNLDPNPHNSVHYGPDLDCDLCHHMHESSENYCNQCHEFTHIVP